MRGCSFAAALTAVLYLTWGCSSDSGLFGDSSNPSSNPTTGSSTGGAEANGGGGAGGSLATASGGASTSGTATGGSSSSGGQLGSRCQWGDACDDGLFCDAPGCTQGTCQNVLPIDQEQPELTPVCGCDQVTYWNASIAQSHAMAVKATGECPASGQLECNDSMPCPQNAACSQRVDNAVGCNFPSPSPGSCWGLPQNCRKTDIKVANCGNFLCGNRCEAVSQGQIWYESICF